MPSNLTSEPKIIEIRNGSKVILNSTSLKHFNEELNTLEVFAYAHDEIDKLSGQLLLDVANRLPVLLKRRYLDYLTKIGSDLNRPKFDTLRKFVVVELSVSTSDYAQTFYRSAEKDKCQKGGERGSCQPIRVRQVAVTSDNGHPPGGYHQQGSNIARESGVVRPEGYPSGTLPAGGYRGHCLPIFIFASRFIFCPQLYFFLEVSISLTLKVVVILIVPSPILTSILFD